MSERRRRRLTVGSVLIVLGLGFFYLQRFEGLGGAAILLFVGAVFLAAYLFRRAFGFLVPAGILLGLGAGEILENHWFREGEPALLGLGVGFLGIYVVARLYEGATHWWPLIPGTILVLTAVPGTRSLLRYLFENWPLLLVVIGVILLLSALRRSTGRGAGPE